MVALPARVRDLISRPESVKILITSDAANQPRGIVCGSIFVPAEDVLAVGEVVMRTTRKNLSENNKVAFSVVLGAEAYNISAEIIERSREPSLLDPLNQKLDRMNLKAGAVWTFRVTAVFDEGLGPDSGRKIA